MGNTKTKFANGDLKIEFEGDSRAFDGNHPIAGVVKINLQENFPAFSLVMRL
jgi:hypothetical protein